MSVSASIRIACEACQAEYTVHPPSWVLQSSQGFRFRCSGCGNSQHVDAPAGIELLDDDDAPLPTESALGPETPPTIPPTQNVQTPPPNTPLQLKQGEQVFPFSDWDMLRKWISEGRVDSTHLVSEDGTSWIPVNTHSELVASFSGPSVPFEAPPILKQDTPSSDVSSTSIGKQDSPPLVTPKPGLAPQGQTEPLAQTEPPLPTVTPPVTGDLDSSISLDSWADGDLEAEFDALEAELVRARQNSQRKALWLSLGFAGLICVGGVFWLGAGETDNTPETEKIPTSALSEDDILGEPDPEEVPPPELPDTPPNEQPEQEGSEQPSNILPSPKADLDTVKETEPSSKSPKTKPPTTTPSKNTPPKTPEPKTAQTSAPPPAPKAPPAPPAPTVTPDAPSVSTQALTEEGWGLVHSSPSLATSRFEQALKQSPTDLDANYGYGYALLRQEKPNEAKPYLCKALMVADTESRRELMGILRAHQLQCE